MNDPERIWLQSYEDTTALGEDRLWCEDKVWPECEEQQEPTEYIRADLYASRISQQDAELDRMRREVEEAKEFRAILEGHLSAAIDDYNEARKGAFIEAVEIALVFAGKHEPSYGLVNREIHEAILAVVTALRAKAEETSSQERGGDDV